MAHKDFHWPPETLQGLPRAFQDLPKTPKDAQRASRDLTRASMGLAGTAQGLSNAFHGGVQQPPNTQRLPAPQVSKDVRPPPGAAGRLAWPAARGRVPHPGVAIVHRPGQIFEGSVSQASCTPKVAQDLSSSPSKSDALLGSHGNGRSRLEFRRTPDILQGLPSAFHGLPRAFKTAHALAAASRNAARASQAFQGPPATASGVAPRAARQSPSFPLGCGHGAQFWSILLGGRCFVHAGGHSGGD